VQVAGKVQGQDNHQDHTYAEGVVAPVLTVRPNGKAPHKRDNNDYRENEEERHGLAASLTVAAESLATSAVSVRIWGPAETEFVFLRGMSSS